MLKKWLEKLKGIFQSDDMDEGVKPHDKKSDIKARMTYQYPESKPFRFPIIPDDEAPMKEKDNIPAYLRRKETDRQPERARKTSTSERPTRKVYRDETAPPFQLTEVPSPVYGLQKRNKKIEEVPAYRRREENVEQTEERPGDFAKVEKEIQKEIPVMNEIVAEEQAAGLEETREEKEEASDSSHDELKTIQQLAKEEQKKPNLHKPEAKRNSNRENRKSRNKRQANQTSVPFNVWMTPEDKERMQKKEHRQPAETKPAHEQKPEDKMEKKQSEKELQAPLYLLNDQEIQDSGNEHWIDEQQQLLEQTLKHFHVAANVVQATQGPSVTRFEVQPELGVKVSKIRNLSDDLKLNMSAKDIRIEAPIPGKNTVGIEIPNPVAQTVGLQEIIESDEFKQSKSPLTVALGLTIEGKPKITNIQKMPHGLIAGATGSGKSVCINTILVSILYKASHEDVKFLLIDPKMVELAPYNGIPHLVAPVITDVKAATQSLKWAVNEMEDRYERFMEEGVRDMERYNRKVIGQGRNDDKMPYIIIVIDELADLMMMSPQDVESSISRIAQKARACGIHLLLATQRPSVDVITGLIKANIPTRIAFSVSSQVDSRTIIDTSGAEKLLGKGDMLFMENGAGKSIRLQGPFVSDDEIERVTAFSRELAEPEYLFEQEHLLEQIQLEEDEDELLEEAIAFVVRQQSASTSMLQRHFKIGYNRAARLIDTLEARGIISGQNGSKPRDVLITEANVE